MGLIVLATVLTGAIAFQMVKVNKEFNTKINRIKAESVKLEQLRLKEEEAKALQQKQDQDARNAEIQKQIDELKSRVEAKKKSTIASKVLPNITQKVFAASGSCSEWMTAAGVTDMANAAELIRRESGCNPNAVNRNSGACGIPQALPCSKLGTNDPIAQIRWMQNYVISRYGGWAQAVAWHNSHNWY